MLQSEGPGRTLELSLIAGMGRQAEGLSEQLGSSVRTDLNGNTLQPPRLRGRGPRTEFQHDRDDLVAFAPNGRLEGCHGRRRSAL